MGPHDHPFYDVVKEVEKHMNNGNLCYQKFTCAQCGERLTMEIPNRMYTEGTCDRCGYLTNIEKQGCNYLLVAMMNKRNPNASWNLPK